MYPLAKSGTSWKSFLFDRHSYSFSFLPLLFLQENVNKGSRNCSKNKYWQSTHWEKRKQIEITLKAAFWAIKFFFKERRKNFSTWWNEQEKRSQGNWIKRLKNFSLYPSMRVWQEKLGRICFCGMGRSTVTQRNQSSNFCTALTSPMT